MRLICPNCSAQYEIDASLIPDEGRDVQCSNCGHTWFELPPAPPAYADAPEPEPVSSEIEAEPEAVFSEELAGAEPEREEEFEAEAVEERSRRGWADDQEDEEAEADGTRRDGEPEPEEAVQAEPEHAAAPEEESEPEPEIEAKTATEDLADDDDLSDDDDLTDEDDGEPEEAAQPSAAARAIAAATQEVETGPSQTDPFAAAAAAGAAFNKRRPADVAALDILREEAERELTQRRVPPTTPLETQTDMAFNDGSARATPSRALRARMARDGTSEPGMAGKKDARVHSPEESYEAPRRDLLPDIDEINSSLKSRKRRVEQKTSGEPDRRKGFRAGFLLMISLAVLLILAYAWAPALARALPALEGPLLVYVDLANGVRDWIDGLIGGA